MLHLLATDIRLLNPSIQPLPSPHSLMSQAHPPRQIHKEEIRDEEEEQKVLEEEGLLGDMLRYNRVGELSQMGLLNKDILVLMNYLDIMESKNGRI